MTNPLALVVDDEEDLCTLMQLTLDRMGVDSLCAYNLAEAYELLESARFDLCFTDLNLPDGDGLELVDHLAKTQPDLPVAVITAHGSTDLAIEALRRGAFDFVNKPLELSRLNQLTQNALQTSQKKASSETQDPAQKLMIGSSAIMNQVRTVLKKVARSQAPVFLRGASGTGKEVAAQLIHTLSSRSNKPFVAVNCGAIPSELMESQFFGHQKGSFTGAVSNKTGFFQAADGGTLFLDEVADLPLPMQVKLLRAIQEKKVRALGASDEVPVDVRLISATHKDMNALMEEGAFREDLFYRIHVVDVCLPPLSERESDVLELADFFLAKIAEDWDLDQVPVLSSCARTAMVNHRFPGNVRELRNMLERAITLTEDQTIRADDLQLGSSAEPTPAQALSTQTTQMPALQTFSRGSAATQSAGSNQVNYSETDNNLLPVLSNIAAPSVQVTASTPGSLSGASLSQLPEGGLEAYLELEEKRLILEALEQSGGNRTQAAQLLSMSFRSFRYRIKKLNMDDML